MELTVAEALKMENLKNARLLAGEKGLARVIRCVDISETPDANEWVRKNEFLITTGYSIKDEISAQLKLLKSLAEADGAGLAVKFGRFIGDVPQELVTLADALSFPLIYLPDDLPFIDITYPLMRRIVNEQAQKLVYSEKIYKTLTKVALDTNCLENISQALGEIIGKETAIYTHRLRSSVISAICGEQQTFPVKVKKQIYGYIVVKSKEPLSEHAMVAVRHTQILAALQMVNYALSTESAWNRHRDFLEELCGGVSHDIEFLRARAHELGFLLEGIKCICIVDVDDFSQYILGRHMTEQQTEDFRRMLFYLIKEIIISSGDYMQNSLVVQQNDRVVLLAAGEKYQTFDWEKFLAKVHEQISRSFPDITVTIAISNPVQLLADLPQARRDTQHLITISRQLYGNGKDLYQKDAEIYLLLEKMNMEPVCNRMLGRLLSAKKKDEFLVTLQAYLNCQGNLSETAARLFIHRNTLRYRLSRIEELLEKDLSVPETRFMLWLVLKARQMHTD